MNQFEIVLYANLVRFTDPHTLTVWRKRFHDK